MKLEISEFKELKMNIEETTGFVCYEGMPGDQLVWYGTSDKLDEFKTSVNDILPTGTIAFTMDNVKKYIYSSFKKTWYEL